MSKTNLSGFKTFIFLIVLSLSSTWTFAHKYYVSLTTINYSIESQTFEITMRLFPDDLDLAIKHITGENPHLSTKLEHNMADKWLREYISNHFRISSEDINLPINYLGKEAEGNALWVYLESDTISGKNDIILKNTILTEMFSEQKNIVQIYIQGFNKGFLFDKEQIMQNIIVDADSSLNTAKIKL